MTDCREQGLTEIAVALKKIGRSLQNMQKINRTNHAAPPVENDCSRCLCGSCARNAACRLKMDDVMPEIYGSPCNGCELGERFRPEETRCCREYVKEDTDAAYLQNSEHGTCTR